MRYLIQILVAGTMILSTATTYADLGDQLAILLPEDGTAFDFFGHSVAISGTTAIVGAYYDDNNGRGSGSAYLFDISDPVNPRQIFKLLPNDGEADDNFGYSVAISGATAIVGAHHDNDNGRWSGSAYVFDTSDPKNPVQIAKLLPEDGAAGDNFGISVAISGTTAIVGAPHDAWNGGWNHRGSAYLFDATSGVQLAILRSGDSQPNDFFGSSVAVSGLTAIIGAWNHHNEIGYTRSAAYLFETIHPYHRTFKLSPPSDVGSWARFGWSVAISDITVVIGAPYDDDNGDTSGSVCLFNTTTGQQLCKLLPNDGEAEDYFGSSVAISGATVIVGAPKNDDNGTDSGSAYLFDAGSSTEITATLTSFGVVNGILLNGELADLGSSDDSHVHTRSGFGSTLVDLHNMEMRISATTTEQSPTTLDLTIESRIDQPAGTAQVRLLNHNTAEFDPVGQYPLGNADAIDTILDIDATNFVSAQGDIEMSIKHLVFVPFLAFTFESFVDWVEIVVR